MACLVFGLYSLVVGLLQLMNISTFFTKGLSEKIEDMLLRRRYLRLCGVIRIVLAAVFFSMVWSEPLLPTPWFVALYILLTGLVIVWQIFTNRKYFGSSR